MPWRHFFIALGAVALIGVGYLAGLSNVARQPPSDANPAATAPPGPTPDLPGGPPTTAAPGAPPVEFVQFQVPSGNVKAIFPDGEAVWIGSSRGVIRFDESTGRHTTIDNRSGLLSNGVFHLGRIRNELWVGTYGGGLSVLDVRGRAWRNYNVPNGMGDSFVYHALEAKNGDIWIATWSGANRVVGGAMDKIENWELYTVENTKGGLPNDWVYRLAEGRDGEIWLATEGGLARFADGRWTSWNHAAGIGAPYDAVKADIAFRNDPARFSSHHAMQKQEQGLGGVDVAYNPNYIVALHVGADGRVWAGTWGAGLSVFDGRNWRTYTQRDGLPSNHVFALEADRAGRIWIGTGAGLARMDGERFVRYGREHGLYSENVFSIAFAENGDTWVGSFGGVTRYRGKLEGVPPGTAR